MAFFKDMMDKIFKVEAKRPHDAAPPGSRPAKEQKPEVAAGWPAGAPGGEVDVEKILEEKNENNPQDLDWRHSIVDLMKLLGMDSSLSERKELARDLGYTGELDGSAEMNIWLHKQVMRKLSENGGRVPPELLD